MIADLITRVAEATGPDREIDDAVDAVFDTTYWNEGYARFEASPVSASIDAVVALIRREMPGVAHLVGTDGGGKSYGHVGFFIGDAGLASCVEN